MEKRSVIKRNEKQNLKVKEETNKITKGRKNKRIKRGNIKEKKNIKSN